MIKEAHFQVENKIHFTQMANSTVRDKNLTGLERAILMYILSHDLDKFKLTRSSIYGNFPESKYIIKKSLLGLKKKHYLKIVRDGFSGWKYVINDFGLPFAHSEREPDNVREAHNTGYSPYKNTNLKNTKKEKESEEKKAEPSPANIITSSSQLTPNQLAQGFKSTRQIKETIYQYLQSKGIPISPGADEQAIEKHRLTDPSELIFKIQRLEKLHYLKSNWREWENWIDKTQLPLFQKLELQAGSISWALSNYSTDIDPLYNLIESFIRRRDEAERRRIAEREKQEALREENYRRMREQEPIQDAPHKTIIERVQERSKPPEPEEAFQPIVRSFTEEQKARMTELLLKRDRTLEENIELNELMGRRV